MHADNTQQTINDQHALFIGRHICVMTFSAISIRGKSVGQINVVAMTQPGQMMGNPNQENSLTRLHNHIGVYFTISVREKLTILHNHTRFYVAVNARETFETRAIECVEFVVRTVSTIHAAPLSASHRNWNGNKANYDDCQNPHIVDK